MSLEVQRKGSQEVSLQQKFAQPEEVKKQNDELAMVLCGNKNEEVKDGPKNKLNFNDFDYGTLGCVGKKEAPGYARNALNEIKEFVREYNMNFPKNAYVVDYDSFPDPAKFTRKQFGSKDKAYERWKDAVDDWKNDIKNELNARKSNNLGDMESRITQYIDSGFFDIYYSMGVTREQIKQMLVEYKGDLNKVKEELDGKLNDLQKGVNRAASAAKSAEKAVHQEAEETRAFVKWTTGDIREAVYKDGEYTRDVVAQNSEGLHDHISYAQHEVSHQIRADKKEQERVSKLQTQINIALRNNPRGSSHVIRKLLKNEGYRMDLNIRKNLNAIELQNIISSITDVELLLQITAELTQKGYVR